jgi:hypothetical protein
VPDRVTLGVAVAGSIGVLILGVLFVDPVVVGVLGTAIVVGHVLALPDALGRRRTIVPAVVVAAAAFDVPVVDLAVALLWAVPIGWIAARIVHGERVGGDAAASSSAGGTAFLVVYGVVHAIVGHGASTSLAAHLTAAAAGGMSWLGAAAVIGGLRVGSRRSVSRRNAIRHELGGWPVHLALLAIGAIFAITLPVMGWPAVVMAGLPYGFIHLSLSRMERARETFRSTVDVLGRIPEAGGFAEPGRSRRVAEVAATIAAELGLSRAEFDAVDQAARLHALGRVVLSDPSIASSSYSERDLAQWGAAIVGEAAALGRVAVVIAAHQEPYRSDGVAASDGVPVESRILRVALAFDAAVAAGADHTAALDELHRGMAYDYDPDVVAALRRHLVRRGLVAA